MLAAGGSTLAELRDCTRTNKYYNLSIERNKKQTSTISVVYEQTFSFDIWTEIQGLQDVYERDTEFSDVRKTAIQS